MNAGMRKMLAAKAAAEAAMPAMLEKERQDKIAQRAADQKARPARPASEKQISYLKALLRKGNASDLSVKLPADLTTLTMDQASAAISEMKGQG